MSVNIVILAIVIIYAIIALYLNYKCGKMNEEAKKELNKKWGKNNDSSVSDTKRR